MALPQIFPNVRQHVALRQAGAHDEGGHAITAASARQQGTCVSRTEPRRPDFAKVCGGSDWRTVDSVLAYSDFFGVGVVVTRRLTLFGRPAQEAHVRFRVHGKSELRALDWLIAWGDYYLEVIVCHAGDFSVD